MPLNPHDPKWELYLEARLGWQLAQTLAGCGRIEYLWKEQEGRCVVCGQPLRIARDCQIHHRIWRSRGVFKWRTTWSYSTPTVIGRSTCKKDGQKRPRPQGALAKCQPRHKSQVRFLGGGR